MAFAGVLLGYRSNQPKSSNANMGTTTVATNFAIIRRRKISPATGHEPLPTASPLDNVQEALSLVRSTYQEKDGISEQFSYILLRNHCFETQYLFKWTGGWLEHLLWLHGILLGCSWVTGATNQSQGTPKWAQHAS